MSHPSNFGEHEARLRAMYEAGYPQGVVLDPTPVTAGEEVAVLYYGLLHKSGADQVYLHAGYGDARNWSDVTDIRMEKTGWGWVSIVKMPDRRQFNLCFRDSASNWDNNNGINWSIQIHNGEYQ
jgi:hypothetical protein